MAKIHALQPVLTSAGAYRLSSDLRAMMDAGIDLGPRGPQIRASGEHLKIMVAELRRKLSELEVSDGLDELLLNLERLARIASTYDAS